MLADGGGQQWGWGGGSGKRKFLAARGPCGLNNVQKWGLGAYVGGDGVNL